MKIPLGKYIPEGVKDFLGLNIKALTKEAEDSSFVAFDSAMGGNSIAPNTLMENDKNWVAVCVHKIAETISGVPLQLKRYNKEGEDEEIFEHAILDVLDKPNGIMTGKDLLYFIAAHQEIVGNAYLLQDKEKNPTQLFPLPPQNVKVELNKGMTEIAGYMYAVGTFKKHYKPEEVVHLKMPNAANPLRGKSIMEKIAEWIDVDNYATDFNRRFFLNGAMLSGNLVTDYTTKEGLELAKLGFEMRHKGAANAHKVGVLPKGVKFEPSTLPPKDMQFVEMDTRFRDKVLSAFGVPKSVLGIVEDVNRANAEASNYVFMQFTIQPKMERLVAYLNEFFLPRFAGTENLYIDFPSIVPENEELKLKWYQASLGNQAWSTVNEVRGAIGLPEIEGGDELPSPMGFTLGADGKPTGTEFKMKAIKVSATKQGKRPWYVKRSLLRKNKLENKKGELVEEAIKAVLGVIGGKDQEEAEHKKFIVRVSAYEKKFKQKMIDADRKVRKEALGNLPDARGISGGMVKAIGDKLVDKKKATNAIIDFATPLLGELVESEGKAQMDKLPTDVSFNLKDPKLQKRMRELIELTGEKYTETTIKLLNKKLGKAIEDGATMDEMTKIVNDVFDFTESFRGARVARSTVFGVANTAAREAYKQSGVVKAVKWHTAEDEMVCEFCGPMNGKVIDIDDTFFDQGDTVRGRDGGELDVDFSDVEDPPLHANCRCFTLASQITVNDAAPKQEDEEVTFLTKAIEIMEHGQN